MKIILSLGRDPNERLPPGSFQLRFSQRPATDNFCNAKGIQETEVDTVTRASEAMYYSFIREIWVIMRLYLSFVKYKMFTLFLCGFCCPLLLCKEQAPCSETSTKMKTNMHYEQISNLEQRVRRRGAIAAPARS